MATIKIRFDSRRGTKPCATRRGETKKCITVAKPKHIKTIKFIADDINSISN